MPSADLIFLHAPTVYDFRRRATLWGPTSDLVPSEPVFDMYPLGFSTMTAYLEQAGFRTRIANLAARMVRSPRFDAERLIARLEGRAFGIDLHWLPHAHGTLGFITLISEHFCYHCNRLHLTADGQLRPCLLSDKEIDLRGAAWDTLSGSAASKKAITSGAN